MAASRSILGTRIDAIGYRDAVESIMAWAETGQSRMVCAANVHTVMTGYDRPEFRCLVNKADLITADGMPLVWALRGMGLSQTHRIYGPDLMAAVCEAAARRGVPVGLFGGRPETGDAVLGGLKRRFPGLRIVFFALPPFRRLSEAESRDVADAAERAGVRILFVGLGCPKQEAWMAAQRGRLRAVMLGVGAAFDQYAGRVRRAPGWMQRSGLEWLFRLLQEPLRLGPRYLRHNPRFLALVASRLWLRHCSRRRRPLS